MGIISFIRNRKLGRRVIDVLFAPGRYEPAVTRTTPAGTTVVVQDEVVEPKGWLMSGTIWASLVAAVSSGTAIVAMLKAGIPDDTVFSAAVAAFAGAVAAIWRHVRSWMPTKGAATPKPSPPAG